MNTRIAALLIVPLLLLGCGGVEDVAIPSAPVVIDQADQDLLAGTAKALGILESATLVVEATQTLEFRLACVQAVAGQQVPIPGCSAVVPAHLHRQIDGLFRSYAEAVVTAVDHIEQGAVTAWPELRATLDPVLSQVEALARLVQQIVAQAEGGADLSTWMRTIQQVVSQIGDIFPRQPAHAEVF
jgi:hypothetical protein